jgi:hypothetical protein
MAESAEGARLLSECRGVNLYRGFESLSLRQINKLGLMGVLHQPFVFCGAGRLPHHLCNLSNLQPADQDFSCSVAVRFTVVGCEIWVRFAHISYHTSRIVLTILIVLRVLCERP